MAECSTRIFCSGIKRHHANHFKTALKPKLSLEPAVYFVSSIVLVRIQTPLSRNELVALCFRKMNW